MKKLFLLLTVTCLALAGCRGSSTPRIITGLQPAHGKVLDAEGKPVAGGVITFSGSGKPGSIVKGEIGKDGTFTLSTYNGPTGETGVTVTATPYAVFIRLADGTNYQLKKTYLVKEGDNDFTIQLTRDAYYP